MVVWKELIRWSRIACGSVYCESMRGLFKITCIFGIIMCVCLCEWVSARWYYGHSHCYLALGTVITCWPMSPKMCPISC